MRFMRPILLFTALGTAFCSAMSPETKAKFDWALSGHNWESLTPEVLTDSSNRDWVEKVRKYGLKSHRADATIPFLNAGDPDMIGSCLNEFRHDWRSRSRIVDVLISCSQPRIIVAMGDELSRTESAEPRVVGGDMEIPPPSGDAGWVIAHIIQNNPSFNPNAKEWAAREYRFVTPGLSAQAREEMRTFWAENKELLKAERYAEVQPPSGWKPPKYPTRKSAPASSITPTMPPASASPILKAASSPSGTAVPPKLAKAPHRLGLIFGLAGIFLAAVVIGLLALRARRR